MYTPPHKKGTILIFREYAIMRLAGVRNAPVARTAVRGGPCTRKWLIRRIWPFWKVK